MPRYELGRCYLQNILDEVGWSQQDLADRMGWERQRVSDYCRKVRTMSVPVLFAVADTLGVDPRRLYELIPVKKSR
jgi:transcriptional regulator with XRE-family HTH domain